MRSTLRELNELANELGIMTEWKEVLVKAYQASNVSKLTNLIIVTHKVLFFLLKHLLEKSILPRSYLTKLCTTILNCYIISLTRVTLCKDSSNLSNYRILIEDYNYEELFLFKC